MITLLEEMQAQADCEKYISWRGKTCYRTHGDLSWYMLKCKQYLLTPEHVECGNYTAKGNGFEFDYIEHDIIYAVGN